MNNYHSRANLAIDLIFVMFITLISISLLMAFFGTRLPGLGKDVYCNTFFHLYSSDFVPSNFRVDRTYCKPMDRISVIPMKAETATQVMFSNGREAVTLSGGAISIPLPGTNVSQAIMKISTNIAGSQGVQIYLGGSLLRSFPLSRAESPYVLNFTPEAVSYISGTGTSNLPLDVHGINITLHALQVDYVRYFPNETLAFAIVDCWRQASFGQRTSDLACYELTLSEDVKSALAGTIITEEDITRSIMETGLCEIFPNQYTVPATAEILECGQKHSLIWGIGALSSHTNILVEYQSKERKIAVS